jgi:pimeloyl-ACP methyl ester carboxylesterase
MKMKLAQRFLIGYYKTKLRTIGLVSPRKAAEIAFEIFCTPYGGRAKTKEPPVFHQAEKLSFDLDGVSVRGFRWIPEHPNGKKILIAHGFRSYAYKFEKHVTLLKKEGFEVLAFDAPAHGSSDGKLINAYIYKNMILKIEALYGPLFGIMGHSLGGLAAALAFEELAEPEKRRLVLVAPATETNRAIAGFFEIIPVTDKVKQAFEELISEISGQPVSYYSVSRVVKKIQSPIFWIHDQHDPICPFADVKPLLSVHLPGTRFMITEHLGHSKVYKDSGVCKAIVQFFNGTEA